MEEASVSIVIPGWIWVSLAFVVVGVIVALVIHSERRVSRRHRSSSRRHRSSAGHSPRHRSRSPGPFEKL